MFQEIPEPGWGRAAVGHLLLFHGSWGGHEWGTQKPLAQLFLAVATHVWLETLQARLV